jgi:hypothetical protein
MGTKLKTIETIIFWIIMLLGAYIIPKSYKEWRETENKLQQISQGEAIEGFDTQKRIKITEDRVKSWLKESYGKDNSLTFSPPASNRKFWDSLEKPHQKHPQDIKDLNFSPIEIIKTGTSQECFYNTGEWIPEINNALKEIIKENWHDESFGRPFVDLYSTIKAREISNCIAMLEDKLNAGVVLQAKKEIRKRILDPFRRELEIYQVADRHFGRAMCPWLGGTTNWTAVCITNIIYCSLVVDSIEEQANIIAKSKDPIENYLQCFESDGHLPSGIRYWRYGFKHLLMLSELLYKRTNGNIDILTNPKFKEIVVNPLNSYVGRNFNQDLEFYPLFADNKNPVKTEGWIWEILKKRYDLPKNHPLLVDREIEPFEEYGGVLDLLAYKSKQPESNPKEKVKVGGSSHFFKSNGALISRYNNGDEVVAIAGGTNGTEHNHNDLGSYTFFSKDPSNYWLPIAGDMGDIKYRQYNFASATRYTIDLLSSYGHPVPVVNNQLQITGIAARSITLSHSISNQRDSVTYSLIHAYNVPELETLTRTAIVHKEKNTGLQIIDSFKASYPISFESPIITATNIEQKRINEKTNQIILEYNVENERFVITIENADKLSIDVKELDTIDFYYQRPTKVKTSPFRVGVSLKNRAQEGTIEYRIRKVQVANQPIEYKAIPPRKMD